LQIGERFKLSVGDMPPVDVIRQRLSHLSDFSNFPDPDADIQELNRVRKVKDDELHVGE
jgi:hypothetical protein